MDDGEDIFRERTADRGIDFYYDEAAGTLRLRIRYSSLVISDEVVLLLETIAMPEGASHNSILMKWGKLSRTSFFSAKLKSTKPISTVGTPLIKFPT